MHQCASSMSLGIPRMAPQPCRSPARCTEEAGAPDATPFDPDSLRDDKNIDNRQHDHPGRSRNCGVPLFPSHRITARRTAGARCFSRRWWASKLLHVAHMALAWQAVCTHTHTLCIANVHDACAGLAASCAHTPRRCRFGHGRCDATNRGFDPPQNVMKLGKGAGIWSRSRCISYRFRIASGVRLPGAIECGPRFARSVLGPSGRQRRWLPSCRAKRRSSTPNLNRSSRTRRLTPRLPGEPNA